MKYRSLLLPLLAGATACMNEPALGESEQGVYHGIVMDPGWIAARHLVKVDHACSGVLLSNHMVLTAGHCIDEGRTSELPIEYNGQSLTSTRVYRFGDGGEITGDTPHGGGPNFAGVGADLGALWTDVPFEVDGSTEGFGTTVEPDTAAELEGKSLWVYGLGFDESLPMPAGDWGTWRAGQMTVMPSSYTVNDLLSLRTEADTKQGIRHGDSGGPSFLEDESGARLVGIHARAFQDLCGDSGNCDADDQLVYPDLGGILLAFDHLWNPDAPTDAFEIFPAELGVMRESDFDVNNVGWAAMARTSTKLCRNRMYVGGHATGHQYQTKHGVACSSGDPYAVALDARYANIPAGVYDLDQTPWDVAQRAAMTTCREVTGGSSGYWSGFSKRGDTYGLVCLTAAYANLKATPAQLQATGWPVGNLAQTSYAQALRAAHGFCTTRGYESGYLTGQFDRIGYGVTCQRSRVL